MITKTRCWPPRRGARRRGGAQRRRGGAEELQAEGLPECHKKFEEKYGSAKHVHGSVKQRKCEDCHLRHGIVPQLALKKAGDELCYCATSARASG